MPNRMIGDLGTYTFTFTATGHPASGKEATLAVLANGLPRYRHSGSTTWTYTGTFDARLVKGHNSIRFSLEESAGSVDVTNVRIKKDGWLTSPTDPDTDRDGLWDGAELHRDSGWVSAARRSSVQSPVVHESRSSFFAAARTEPNSSESPCAAFFSAVCGLPFFVLM